MNESNWIYDFYEHAVLPQFGYKNRQTVWTESYRIEADEFAHAVDIDSVPHILIWEDYQGLGSNVDFLKDHVTNGASFEFIEPLSQTGAFPSYDGFRLPTPSQYCENVTGTFTLIKLTQ